MRRILLTVTLLFLSSAALGQWVWRQGSTTVFSDQPPPPDIAPAQIIKRPAESANAAELMKNKRDVAPENSTGTKQIKSLAEREAEFRERREKRIEQDKKTAEEAAKKQQNSQECERARSYLKALQEGIRIRFGSDNAVMGEDERQKEVQRVQKQVSEACK
jgi:hypothetical protein